MRWSVVVLSVMSSRTTKKKIEKVESCRYLEKSIRSVGPSCYDSFNKETAVIIEQRTNVMLEHGFDIKLLNWVAVNHFCVLARKSIFCGVIEDWCLLIIVVPGMKVILCACFRSRIKNFWFIKTPFWANWNASSDYSGESSLQHLLGTRTLNMPMWLESNPVLSFPSYMHPKMSHLKNAGVLNSEKLRLYEQIQNRHWTTCWKHGLHFWSTILLFQKYFS